MPRSHFGHLIVRHHRYVFLICLVESPASMLRTALDPNFELAADSTAGHHSDAGGKGKNFSSRSHTLEEMPWLSRWRMGTRRLPNLAGYSRVAFKTRAATGFSSFAYT